MEPITIEVPHSGFWRDLRGFVAVHPLLGGFVGLWTAFVALGAIGGAPLGSVAYGVVVPAIFLVGVQLQRRAMTQLARGAAIRVTVSDDGLRTEAGRLVQELPFDRFRRARRRGRQWVLRMNVLMAVVLPVEAFDPGQEVAFADLLRRKGLLRP